MQYLKLDVVYLDGSRFNLLPFFRVNDAVDTKEVEEVS